MRSLSLLAALVLSAASAIAAPPTDPTTALRQAVQLDPARGERLAAAAEVAALRLPPGEDRQLQILTARFFRAEALLQLNRPDAAAPIVDAALLEIPQSKAGKKLTGQFLMARAGIFSGKGQAAASLHDLQSAYRLFVEVANPRNAAVALMSIGSIYQDAGDYNRVLYYYRLADDAYSSDVLLRLSSANNQANALAALGRYKDAEASYRLALGFARQQHSPVLEARILNNISNMQLDLRHLDAAAATLEKGLAIADHDDGAAEWRPLLLSTKASLALTAGRPADAVKLIEQAVAGKSPSVLADQSYRDVHRVAYLAYAGVGRSRQALAHLEIYRKLDDEGRALVSETSAALLSARFDFANQNARIAALKTGQLQRDVALARLKARQSAMVLGGLLLTVTIIAVGLALYLRALRRSRDAIRAANAALIDVNAQLTDALAAKSRFLATTSHEIRTPLNGVLGMAQVLLAEPAVAGVVRQRLVLLKDAGETMRRLVDDILEFAKIDAGSVDIERSTLDLHNLLDESARFWEPQAQNLGLEITYRMQQLPQYVFEDGRRLRQILYNLLANALKFTPEGSVTLVAEAEPSSAGEMLKISVIDTGIGIPKESLGTIFEMFSQVDSSTTRRFGGSGLGLAISLNLARALGGDLTVESVVGRGSTFTLTLPLVRGITSAEPVRSAQGPATELAHARVAMFGGSPIAQRTIESLIAESVALVTVAGADALKSDAGWSAADIVILDNATIAAADIAVLVQRMAASGRSPRIIVLAAAGQPPEELLGSDAVDVLARPFSAAQLIDALKRSFSRLVPETTGAYLSRADGVQARNEA